MAATVAEAWQQVQQKNLPPPLPPSLATLITKNLDTKVAAKQQKQLLKAIAQPSTFNLNS